MELHQLWRLLNLDKWLDFSRLVSRLETIKKLEKVKKETLKHKIRISMCAFSSKFIGSLLFTIGPFLFTLGPLLFSKQYTYTYKTNYINELAG